MTAQREKIDEAKRLIVEAKRDTNRDRYGYGITEKLRQAKQLMIQAGNTESANWIQWDIFLFDFDLKSFLDQPERKRERFSPMFGSAKGVYPHIDMINDEALDYYETQIGETDNPRWVTRYLDILWVKRRDYKSAEAAVKEYFKLAILCFDNSWWTEAVDALSRAFEISLELHNSELLKRSKKEIKAAIDQLTNEENFRWVEELLKVYEYKASYFEEEELRKILLIIDKAENFYIDKKDMHSRIEILKTKRAVHNRLKDETGSKRCLEQIAESYETLANMMESHMVKAGFLENALTIYSTLGEQDKINEMHLRIKKENELAVQKEMVPISSEFKLPNEYVEEMQRIIEGIKAYKPSEILQIIALDKALRVIPDVSTIKKQTREQAPSTPLMFLLPTRIQTSRGTVSGKTKGEGGNLEKNFEYNISFYTSKFFFFEQQIAIRWFHGLMRDLYQERKLSSEDIVKFLGENDLWKSKDFGLIRIGLDHYFEEDFPSALHILVPQIEDLVRSSLEQLGIRTTRTRGGSIEFIDLDTVVSNEKLVSGWGRDFHYYFEHVFLNKGGIGWNLRNDAAHGLIDAKACNWYTAATVVHILLVLGRYQLRRGAS